MFNFGIGNDFKGFIIYLDLYVYNRIIVIIFKVVLIDKIILEVYSFFCILNIVNFFR